VATVFSCAASRNKRGYRSRGQFRAAAPPGFRDFGSGDPVSIGKYGYNWSSTSCDAGDHCRSMYLYFGATALHPNYTTPRAYALQLRCLSE